MRDKTSNKKMATLEQVRREMKKENSQPQFHEAMNKFVETQPDTFAEDFTPIIKRQFSWQGNEFDLIIRAAQFSPRKFPVGFYFLAERERIVEQTLRLLATPGNPLFDAETQSLHFSLKQLTKILSEIETTNTATPTKAILSQKESLAGEQIPLLTEDDIKFALEALAFAAFTLQSKSQELYFYPITQFASSETGGEIYYRIRLSNISFVNSPPSENISEFAKPY